MIQAATRTADIIIPAMACALPFSFLALADIRPIIDMIRKINEVAPNRMIDPKDPKNPTMHKTLVFCCGSATTGAIEGAGATGGTDVPEDAATGVNAAPQLEQKPALSGFCVPQLEQNISHSLISI